MKPAIVAPVMRNLGTTDLARAISFYRDQLGFEIRNQRDGYAEATYGPARLEFGTHDYDPLSWEGPKPPGSTILYFEVDDVAAMREAILARGGSPSELQKANWIKMQVFEIRDPDGHTIWFGQSYNEPDLGRPPGQLHQALPHLPCSNIAVSVKHYCGALGFSINHQQHDLGVLDRDQITLLLIEPSVDRPAGSGSCSFYIEDADRLHAELTDKGARVQGTPVSQVWGIREFSVLDPDGNRLTFCQTFE